MQVALKIWRFDAKSGDRALKEYEFDAPEEATLLDCLDIVKDKYDGTLAYRKSCRMMICGSFGMRMDGAAGAGPKQGLWTTPEGAHPPRTCARGRPPNAQS